MYLALHKAAYLLLSPTAHARCTWQLLKNIVSATTLLYLFTMYKISQSVCLVGRHCLCMFFTVFTSAFFAYNHHGNDRLLMQ